MLEIIKLFVRRMMMGKGKGILNIPPKKEVDKFAKDLFKKFKANGVSDSAINNPRDVRAVWEQITNKEAQIMRNNMSDLVKEMDTPLASKKSAEVINLQKIKEDKGITSIPVDEQFTTKRINKIDDELENLSTGEGKYATMSRNDRENLMIKLQDESSTLQEKTLFKDSPEAIAKIKAENKAAIERLRKKKMEDRALEDFTDDFTDDPSGLASGGLARVGMAGGGRLVKGASWVIKNLRQTYDELIQGKGQFSTINSMQREDFKWQLLVQIKKLEQGGKIPDELLQNMRQDKRFKDIVKTPSTDPELRELEEVLLDTSSGKQADQIVDDVFGPLSPEEIKGKKLADSMSDAEIELRGEFPRLSDEKIDNILTKDLFDAKGKLNKEAVLKEVRDSHEKMLLDKFKVTGKKGHASGGSAGTGLNYLLGEDDQNVRTPYQGGIPGLLGE